MINSNELNISAAHVWIWISIRWYPIMNSIHKYYGTKIDIKVHNVENFPLNRNHMRFLFIWSMSLNYTQLSQIKVNLIFSIYFHVHCHVLSFSLFLRNPDHTHLVDERTMVVFKRSIDLGEIFISSTLNLDRLISCLSEVNLNVQYIGYHMYIICR